MCTCRLQADDAAEDHSSSVSSDSEDDLDELRELLVAPDDALEAQEGSSSAAHANARGAHASGEQGCCSAAAGMSVDGAQGSDLERTLLQLSYLDIVESSQMDSQKTCTLSMRLRVESNEQVHILIIVFDVSSHSSWRVCGAYTHAHIHTYV